MPERIQLRRTKGWRKPENTIVVARPSIYGNPFRVFEFKQVRGARREFSVNVAGGVRSYIQSEGYAREIAVAEYDEWLAKDHLDPRHWHVDFIVRHARIRAALRDGSLRGANLACWCPPHHACHADVLLRLANG